MLRLYNRASRTIYTLKKNVMKTNESAPVETGKLGLEVSSRLLHQRLGVKTRHNGWIGRRIEDCLFDEGIDFYILPNLDYSNLSNQDWGGDRRSIEYVLTLGAAKEFWRNQSGFWFVSETFGRTIVANAVVWKLNREAAERRLPESGFNVDYKLKNQ
jgi:phage anti-repressor protein